LPVENVEILFIGDWNKHVVIIIIRIGKPFRKAVSWNSHGQCKYRE
jgi:hypothetical protein